MIEVTNEQHERMAREIIGWEKIPPFQLALRPDTTSWLFLGPLLVALREQGCAFRLGSLIAWSLPASNRWLNPVWNRSATLPDAILAAGLAVLEAADADREPWDGVCRGGDDA